MLQRLAALLPKGMRKKRLLVICAISICFLLCGFSWVVAFSSIAVFPAADAIDVDLIQNFSDIFNAEALMTYLNGNTMSEQIISGIQANLASDVFNIEIPEMHDEPIGKKVVSIILDRLFG